MCPTEYNQTTHSCFFTYSSTNNSKATKKWEMSKIYWHVQHHYGSIIVGFKICGGQLWIIHYLTDWWRLQLQVYFWLEWFSFAYVSFQTQRTTHYYFLLYSVMYLQVYSTLSEILIKSKYCIIRTKGRLWICLS